MNEESFRRFSLHPFPGTGGTDGVTVGGGIGRSAGMLTVSFEISGDIGDIALPAPAAFPQRKDGLWEKTCLELFIAPDSSHGYWEFNFSPSGHWNVYRFDEYRRGMRPEEAFHSPDLIADTGAAAFMLTAAISLDRIAAAEQPLDAGISAVLKRRGGDRSFWALKHCGPRPDFHIRESFIIRLR